jgi:hypothetical protein
MNKESEYLFNIEINPVKSNRFYNINKNKIFFISYEVKLDILNVKNSLIKGVYLYRGISRIAFKVIGF